MRDRHSALLEEEESVTLSDAEHPLVLTCVVWAFLWPDSVIFRSKLPDYPQHCSLGTG